MYDTKIKTKSMPRKTFIFAILVLKVFLTNPVNCSQDQPIVIPPEEDPQRLLLPEQTPDLFEGDIKLNLNEKPPTFGDDLNARRGANYRWPNAIIPFEFNATSSYSVYDKEVIMTAQRDYARYTCIRWVPRTNEANYISIFDGSGCWSYVGFQESGVQQLSLKLPHPSDTGTCIVEGIAQHEMMHASGFYHEQSRTDRDDYVTIEFKNILPGKEHNFAKYSTLDVSMMGIRYDYGSIMHYGNDSFTVDRQTPLLTIVPKKSGVTIGQRKGFSATDQLKLNKYYGCSVPYNVPQPMDSFTSPTSCSFDSNWCGWTQDYKVALDGSTNNVIDYADFDDDFDWLRIPGSTPSFNTGPRQDHTSGKGRYVYIEASSPRTPGDTARIRSPMIKGDGEMCIAFWYNMYSVSSPSPMGTVRVYVADQGYSGRRLLWYKSGNQTGNRGYQWKQGLITYRSANQFQVLIEAIVGSSYQSDVAIDDFSVSQGPCSHSISTNMGNPSWCTFEAGNCGYQNWPQNRFDWQVVSGKNGRISNGYVGDRGSHYLLATGLSGMMVGQKSIITTPPLNVDTGSTLTMGCITFHYFMAATPSASLNVYQLFGSTPLQVWSSSTTNTLFWTRQQIKVSLIPGAKFSVRFEAVRGMGQASDLIAIDFVQIQSC